MAQTAPARANRQNPERKYVRPYINIAYVGYDAIVYGKPEQVLQYLRKRFVNYRVKQVVSVNGNVLIVLRKIYQKRMSEGEGSDKSDS